MLNYLSIYLNLKKLKGTLGTLEFDGAKSSNKITHSSFKTKQTSIIDCSDAVPKSTQTLSDSAKVTNSSIKLSGHGGSDEW